MEPRRILTARISILPVLVLAGIHAAAKLIAGYP
jgi:hypothetical protein